MSKLLHGSGEGRMTLSRHKPLPCQFPNCVMLRYLGAPKDAQVKRHRAMAVPHHRIYWISTLTERRHKALADAYSQ